jgi:predicted O-methyltransferase YrrM
MSPVPGLRHGSPDFSAAHERWGAPQGSSPVQASDILRLLKRWPFARSLARAAFDDPRVFWITAMAVRRHRALQKPLELFAYLRLLRARRPTCILEVGTLWGGTFYAHCAVAEANGHMIAIDSFPRDNAAWMTARFRRLTRPRQELNCLWGDSHDDGVATRVADGLRGRKLDVLFLDGDHSVDGVRRDYDTYSPFVRRGGVIALHDIDAGAPSGVPSLWNELRKRHDSLEFVDRINPPQGLGIGVLIKS